MQKENKSMQKQKSVLAGGVEPPTSALGVLRAAIAPCKPRFLYVSFDYENTVNECVAQRQGHSTSSQRHISRFPFRFLYATCSTTIQDSIEFQFLLERFLSTSTRFQRGQPTKNIQVTQIGEKEQRNHVGSASDATRYNPHGF